MFKKNPLKLMQYWILYNCPCDTKLQFNKNNSTKSQSPDE